jgi:hypothetical protein
MKSQRPHRLYLVASAVFVALVFAAFARKFYLAWLFHSPALSILLLIHGTVMSGWVVLLIAQSALIAAGKTKLHRRVGVFGAFWAGLVVVLGSVTTLHASAREVREDSPMASLQLTITGLELVQMVAFLCLVAAAVWLRNRGDYHKRLMLLTIACMLPSIFPRLPFDTFTSFSAILVGTYGYLAICIGLDTLRHRRLHPAFAWGGALFVVALQLALLGARTSAWQHFLARAVS